LPTLATGPIRAVLLDVDGTLYYQQRLRSCMACELCMLPVIQRSCSAACDIWRVLSMFRRVRESLRNVGEADVCLAQWQYIAAAQRIGWQPAVLENLVVDWLYQRPLKYLRFCRRRGLEAFCGHVSSLPLGHVKRDRVICRARIKRLPRSRGYNGRSCAVTFLRRSMPWNRQGARLPPPNYATNTERTCFF
jgi:hypothetical protein